MQRSWEGTTGQCGQRDRAWWQRAERVGAVEKSRRHPGCPCLAWGTTRGHGGESTGRQALSIGTRESVGGWHYVTCPMASASGSPRGGSRISRLQPSCPHPRAHVPLIPSWLFPVALVGLPGADRGKRRVGLGERHWSVSRGLGDGVGGFGGRREAIAGSGSSVWLGVRAALAQGMLRGSVWLLCGAWLAPPSPHRLATCWEAALWGRGPGCFLDRGRGYSGPSGQHPGRQPAVLLNEERMSGKHRMWDEERQLEGL